MQNVGKTMPLVAGGSGAAQAGVADIGKTVGVMKKNIGIDPPVAFAVVVDGPHRGEHFALHGGRSFIGRGAGSDISLASDDTVSREAHALISYDTKQNSFLVAAGQGRGITYLNDHEVANSEPLSVLPTTSLRWAKAGCSFCRFAALSSSGTKRRKAGRKQMRFDIATIIGTTLLCYGFLLWLLLGEARAQSVKTARDRLVQTADVFHDLLVFLQHDCVDKVVVLKP